MRVAGEVVCWGAWGHGDGNTIWSNQLFPPETLRGEIRKLTGGGGSSCALHADGTTTCWGDQKDLPGEFVDIDGGASGTCGIRRNGTMECFTYSSFAGAKPGTSPLRCATNL